MELHQIEADLDCADNKQANYRPDRIVFLALAIEIAIVGVIVWLFG